MDRNTYTVPIAFELATVHNSPTLRLNATIALPMKKIRTSSRLRALGVAGLLLIGGGLSYLLLARNPENETIFSGARLVPEDALFAVSISTDRNRWQRLGRYGTPESQERFRESLQQLQDEQLGQQGYNYNDDIRPWIGDRATLAVLPPPPIEADTSVEALKADRALLFVLPLENPRRAQQLLDAEAEGASWNERTHRGITVRERDISETSTLAVAAVDRRFVLISDETSAIDRAIDAYKDNQSIQSIPGYNRSWQALEVTDPFASVFFNVPTGLKALSENSTRPADLDVLAELENQGIATTIDLESDGIRFRSLSWLKPNSEKTFDEEVNTPSNIVERLPAATVLAVVGSNLDRLWEEYLQTARANPLLPLDSAWLRSALQQTVDIDLEDELLNWMTGDFSLAFVASSSSEDATFPGALVVLAQTSNREAATNFFNKLDDAVTERYDFQVEAEEINNRRIVRWDTRRKGLDVAHGWLSGNMAFFSVGAPLTETLVSPTDDSLADSRAFETVVPREPQPSNGVFFLNLNLSEGEQIPLIQLPPEQRAFLGAIEAIGVRAGIHDTRSSRYDIFVKIPSL